MLHRKSDPLPDQKLSRSLVSLAAALLAVVALTSSLAQDTSTDSPPPTDADRPTSARNAAETSSTPIVRLVRVPLPITGTVDTIVKRLIEPVRENATGAERPILVLEFSATDENSGAGSEFERCLSLARYLASDRLSGVRTVAYVTGDLQGHAVLPVLACESLIMHPDAELGSAGIDDAHIDDAMRGSYLEIATRRLTIPPAIAIGMLDPGVEVVRATTLDGAQYLLAEDVDALKDSTTVSSVESLIPAGDMGRFTGSDLRLKYGFASHLAADRLELAAALNVPAAAIEQDASAGDAWRPARIDVAGPINGKLVNWVLKSLQQQLDAGDVNFICVWIDSPGGSAADSVRLANFLASLDAAKVRTVAFIEGEARADASIIAVGCEQIVVTRDALLGGSGAVEISRRDLVDLQRSIRGVARARGRDWSLPVALVDRSLAVYRCTRQGTGDVRYYGEAELADQPQPEVWNRGGEVSTRGGITGRDAEEYQLAKHVVSGFDEFKQVYHLDGALESVRPNWAHLFVERLASPRIAGTLLFIAWFTLLIEFSQPGLSVAGFVSACCFVLYFWANVLHGTAGWLEVLMFVTGITFIIIEVFFLPGVGVFGFGGGLLVVGSIVLASQTFVIPRNVYQVEQLPSSLMMVVATAAGSVGALIFVWRYLPHAPVFSRLFLPAPDDDGDEINRREALVNFEYLVGKRGLATTQLLPSGKARFGDDVVDVISDGELIERGSAVCVVEVRGNRVLVERIETG